MTEAPVTDVPPIVHEVLRSFGAPLDAATRAYMEPRFAHDFSGVRVHTGERAAESARAVQARAYTVGRDVVFGAGEYAPSSSAGRRLLAHELTHVVQQSGGGTPPTHFAVDPADSVGEREAATASARLDHLQGSQRKLARSVLQRQEFPSDDIGGVPERARLPSSSATLPYWEATELAECIRIMGEQNSVYCRGVVLGERPQPGPPPPPCSPVGLRRDQYLAEPGTSADDFGLTRLAGNVAVPAVVTTRVGRGVRVERTEAALPPITSVYTQAGMFEEGTAIFMSQGGGDCPSGRYTVRWNITPDGARKIREGEIEHCADFHYAFEISLRRYADAVNSVARRGMTFPSQRAAEAHVTRLVGAVPANWFMIFACLAEKTKLRDGSRVAFRWHVPRPRMSAPRLETRCASTRADISQGSLPQVGLHPPAEIIKDCGETGVPARSRSERGVRS